MPGFTVILRLTVKAIYGCCVRVKPNMAFTRSRHPYLPVQSQAFRFNKLFLPLHPLQTETVLVEWLLIHRARYLSVQIRQIINCSGSKTILVSLSWLRSVWPVLEMILPPAIIHSE